MADKRTLITDLPLDILVLIFPYLDAKSFLSLCSTCRAFQQPSIRLDSAFWRLATRSTFRVPNQPVVQHDGDRWQKMYRRLLTQSRVYTWGCHKNGRLGHSYNYNRMAGQRFHPVSLVPPAPTELHPGLPTEMDHTRDLGVIADMQCGGWSTTLLTSDGSLYTVGVLDRQDLYTAGLLGGQDPSEESNRLQALEYPISYSIAAQYDQSTMTIRQFSSGRSHVLALADSGRIWSWYHVKKPALQVKFANLIVNERTHEYSNARSSDYGQVKQVVAGWSRSSAYVHGLGIIVWNPVERYARYAGDSFNVVDRKIVFDAAEIPKTGYRRLRDAHSESEDDKALGAEVGSVSNYIILEKYVVFVTDIGKVFCGKFGVKNKVDFVLELRQLRNKTGTALDIQGSFRSFAIFRNNQVIISDQAYLEACWTGEQTDLDQKNIRGLLNIPALQHSNVISVAFGDYHYLALHSDGKVTSYGMEPQGCGALGLGGDGEAGAKARGVVFDRFNHNGRLLPHAYTYGRQIWFDKRKHDWLEHIMQGGDDADESKLRRGIHSMNQSISVQAEVSEWLEQESRAWDQLDHEDGLGAYFALSVSAAGWHSGALVLVNDELASSESAHPSTSSHFPRLKLADGTKMPGQKDFDEWRKGPPEWQRVDQPWR